MVNAVRRNGIILAGLVLTGVAGAMVLPALSTVRGSTGPTVLQAQSPIVAAIAMVGLVVFGSLVAIGVARLTNAAVGLFVLGWGLAIVSMRSGTVQELAFGGGSLSMATVETLLWVPVLLAATLVVFRLGGMLPDVHPRSGETRCAGFFSRDALLSALVGLTMLPAVWLLAQTTMKGQVLASVFVGAMVVGLGGRLICPHVQPMLLFVSPIAFGVVGQVIGLFVMHPRTLDAAFVAGAIPAFNRPMPIDWAAGTLLGVAIGLGWARSFLHHEEDEEKDAEAGASVGSTA